MHMVNQLKFPGFNAGGLYRSLSSQLRASAIPAFAGGGLNLTSAAATSTSKQQQGVSATFVINGEQVSGITLSDRAFDSLSKLAVRKRAASLGRRGGAY